MLFPDLNQVKVLPLGPHPLLHPFLWSADRPVHWFSSWLHAYLRVTIAFPGINSACKGMGVALSIQVILLEAR